MFGLCSPLLITVVATCACLRPAPVTESHLLSRDRVIEQSYSNTSSSLPVSAVLAVFHPVIHFRSGTDLSKGVNQTLFTSVGLPCFTVFILAGARLAIYRIFAQLGNATGPHAWCVSPFLSVAQ